MYMLYIDNVLYPVAPGKIVTEYETENTEYTLIDGRRVNVPGGKGLKRISFELLLPMTKYPFAYYEAGFCDGEYYAEQLNKISSGMKCVNFDLYRTRGNSDVTYLMSMKVLVESVRIVEDAENGSDIKAEVVLREHRSVETKIASEKKRGYEDRSDDEILPKTYVVKKGDSLWLIAKRMFGDGSKYKYLAQINNIKPPYTINTGQTIRISE